MNPIPAHETVLLTIARTVCAVVLIVTLAMIAQAVRGKGVNLEVAQLVFRILDVMIGAVIGGGVVAKVKH